MTSSTYYVHMMTKLLADFQIWISMPLRSPWKALEQVSTPIAINVVGSLSI